MTLKIKERDLGSYFYVFGCYENMCLVPFSSVSKKDSLFPLKREEVINISSQIASVDLRNAFPKYS